MSSPSFPKFGSTSDTTYWWTDAKSVPGSYKGANASGYETTYDRIRVASAASSVFFPIYNYATSLGREKPALATFLGFEKDGLLQGYDGCYGVDGEAAFARSTSENGAAEIAPSLCPEGKYGYDPRCRDWYVTVDTVSHLALSHLQLILLSQSGMQQENACTTNRTLLST